MVKGKIGKILIHTSSIKPGQAHETTRRQISTTGNFCSINLLTVIMSNFFLKLTRGDLPCSFGNTLRRSISVFVQVISRSIFMNIFLISVAVC